MSLNKTIVALIVSSFVLVSCQSNSKIKDEVNYWYGKQVYLPTNNQIVNSEKYPFNPLSKKTKILTLINGSCGNCVENLIDWKKLMTEVDTSQVGFIFLCYSIDNLMSLGKMDSAIIKLSYPYYHDQDKKLISKNNFSENQIYQTFLLDAENKVILLGNPIYHDQIKKLYLDKINKRLHVSNNKEGGVRFINEPGRVRIQADEDIIFKDENGMILTHEKMKEMTSSGQYMLEHDGANNIIILKRTK